MIFDVQIAAILGALKCGNEILEIHLLDEGIFEIAVKTLNL